MSAPACRLCRRRRARRSCPALRQDICTVCCATKRLTEIRCPSDCRYLASAQNHPPAAVQRRQKRDLRFLLPIVADLPSNQYRLFVFVQNLLHDVARAAEPPVDDRTVREAAETLAKTYETASKGIIYEHQAAGLAAERLSRALKPLLDDPSAAGGPDAPTAGERDLAAVLRCIERAAAGAEAALGDGSRAYLDLMSRMTRPPATAGGAPEPGLDGEAGDEPRIIIP